MIKRPLRATHHCRHYSYQDGPYCARGHNFSAGQAMALCMPLKDGNQSLCTMREDYSDAERDDWQIHVEEQMERLGIAISALPKPIPLRTKGNVDCPNCGGVLSYCRWAGGASVVCSTTQYCVGPVRFNIATDADWPAPEHDGDGV